MLSDDSNRYLTRYVDRTLDLLLAELPAVMLTGPRGCGKTTTAARRAAAILPLDQPQHASAVAADPDAALAARPRPLLIDEWQQVPESMAAVKRAVDAGSPPGGFLITGSVRACLSGAGWPATGRVTSLAMDGLTVGETEGSSWAWGAIDRLFGAEPYEPTEHAYAPDLRAYIDYAVRGGFPHTIGLSDAARGAWFEGYVEQLVHQDIAGLREIRAAGRLTELIRVLALNTAGMPSIKTLADAAHLDQRTAAIYLDLLSDLAIVDRVPAWSTNRLSRLVKTPKYYLADSGLAAFLTGDTADGVINSGDRMGRLLDTFVAAQLRPLARLSVPRVRLYHLRDTNGQREVDLVLESAAGAIVGIEIKAASAVSGRDARHLAWMRDRIGEAFVRGVVLHTGSSCYPLGDRLIALPIASLWRQ